MPEFAQPYNAALISVALLVLVVIAQSFYSTFTNLLARGGTPGQPVDGDHGDRHWRIYRVHQNSLENFGLFAATVFAAVLLGTSPGWINTLAIIVLIARVTHSIIYILGIGPISRGPRTIAFVVGFMSNAVMALVVLLSALF